MKSFQSRGEIKSNIVKHIIYTNDIFTDYKDTMLPLFLFFVRSTRFWVISLLMLVKLNLKTYTADHGAKALALLKKLQSQGEQVDSILMDCQMPVMDCQMPVMDGFTATHHIRTANEAYSEIPIIAITANALSSDKNCCLQAGMSDYLSKPFHFEDIQEKLHDWLPSEQFNGNNKSDHFITTLNP